jgi:hypothetical protein
MQKRNARRHERTPSDAVVKIRWKIPSGEAHFARGKILDCSESGLRVEVSEPIPTRSYVTLEAPELDRAGWSGWGSVRYCVLRRAKYIVGLELSAGVQWNPAASAAAAA